MLDARKYTWALGDRLSAKVWCRNRPNRAANPLPNIESEKTRQAYYHSFGASRLTRPYSLWHITHRWSTGNTSADRHWFARVDLHSQWVNSVPPYVRKLHFMYEAIRTSGKCRWNIYRTSSKCRWSIYRTSRKRRGTLRIVHKVERSSPTVTLPSPCLHRLGGPGRILPWRHAGYNGKVTLQLSQQHGIN